MTVLTRREALAALAAIHLAGCSDDEGEPNSQTTTPPPTAPTTGSPPAAQEPTWISAVPTVAFSGTAAASYDLRPFTKDFDANKHAMTLAADSKSLPSGTSLDPTGFLKYDGSKPAASVSGIVIDIKDIVK